jgi:hypothetical protein
MKSSGKTYTIILNSFIFQNNDLLPYGKNNELRMIFVNFVGLESKRISASDSFLQNQKIREIIQQQTEQQNDNTMYTEEARRSAPSVWKIRHGGCNKHQHSSAGWVTRETSDQT